MRCAEFDVLEHHDLEELVGIAVNSIRHGLRKGSPLIRDADTVSKILRRSAASFVTLKQGESLRGCIGSLERRRSLAHDVAENAFAAAFRDPRFPPLADAELELTAAEVSVLSTPINFDFGDEPDLLAQLRPGTDGLIIEHDGHKATYLPSVWEMLPEPRSFIEQLRLKAGIEPHVPIADVKIRRYTAQYSNSGALTNNTNTD